MRYLKAEIILQKLHLTTGLFIKNELRNHAAAVSYYFLLSLFPLMLLFITTFDTFLKSHPDFSNQFFYLLSLVNENLTPDFLENLGLSQVSGKALGVLGIINLFWSTRLIMNALQRALDMIFNGERQRKAVVSNFISLILVPSIFLVVLSAAAFNIGMNYVVSMLVKNDLYSEAVFSGVKLFSQIIPVALLIMLVYMCFRFLPANSPTTKSAIKGTILFVASVVILKGGFSLFFNAAKMNFVYGFIGTVIVLLIWVYFVSMLFFFFACFAFVSDNVDVLLINRLLTDECTGCKGFFEKRIFKNIRYIHNKYSRHYKAAESIFEEGDSSDDIYYIISGTAGVYSSDRKIAEINKSEIFGEMSYLLNEDRTATIKAETNLAVIMISPKMFDELIDMNSKISRNIISMLSDRLRKIDRQV